MTLNCIGRPMQFFMIKSEGSTLAATVASADDSIFLLFVDSLEDIHDVAWKCMRAIHNVVPGGVGVRYKQSFLPHFFRTAPAVLLQLR